MKKLNFVYSNKENKEVEIPDDISVTLTLRNSSINGPNRIRLKRNVEKSQDPTWLKNFFKNLSVENLTKIDYIVDDVSINSLESNILTKEYCITDDINNKLEVGTFIFEYVDILERNDVYVK